MKINFKKYSDGLAPAIIQDFKTQKVLMLGFMSEESLEKTMREGRVTFYSRSRKRLWTKGEESGNFLLLKEVMSDCDDDTLLIKAEPTGPVCHTGADTCWSEKNHEEDFLSYLEHIIEIRRTSEDEKSYVRKLFQSGINKMAQKLGEEAVELVIEAKDVNDSLFLNEASDLLFHFLILLQARGYRLEDVTRILKERHHKK